MGKTLIAYFSASGNTAGLAKNLAKAIGADLYEIVPENPYSSKDLDWEDKNSRSSLEMTDQESRPAIAGKVNNMGEYDTVFVGFPIWWYVSPRIINTFLEEYDLSGKKIIPFATSGTSGMGKTNELLRRSCEGAELCEGKRFSSKADVKELEEWARKFL
jgi:flavodoxin